MTVFYIKANVTHFISIMYLTWLQIWMFQNYSRICTYWMLSYFFSKYLLSLTGHSPNIFAVWIANYLQCCTASFLLFIGRNLLLSWMMTFSEVGDFDIEIYYMHLPWQCVLPYSLHWRLMCKHWVTALPPVFSRFYQNILCKCISLSYT